MNIQLLLTGNELMSGHTVDSNSAMIADFLASKAYVINRKVTVSDDINVLISEMEHISQQADILIVNGGLGPTIDDLTAQALSALTSQPIETNEIAKHHLQQWCERRKYALNEANMKQTQLPQGVEIIPNPTGSAVGFMISHNNCLIICTPGVPSELRRMMKETIIGTIAQQFPNNEQVSTIRLQTFGLGESTLQQMVSTELSDWPAEVDLGFRAGLPLLEVKLTIRKAEHFALQQSCYQRLKDKIGAYIIGEDNATLSSVLIELLAKKQQTLTTAESCTGGLIAATMTEIAGASAVFEAGFVTYSNTIKQKIIGVPQAILEEHGAVSEAVVLAMAKGAIAQSDADYAIAVSGIAGPDGGSDEKPVGTVWIAWGAKDNMHAQQLQFTGNRKWFQIMVTATALDLIRRELLQIEEEPRYLRTRK